LGSFYWKALKLSYYPSWDLQQFESGTLLVNTGIPPHNILQISRNDGLMVGCIIL